jgi:transposase
MGWVFVLSWATRLEVSERCMSCSTLAVIKDRPLVSLVDLPAFGRPARLMWHKRRWRCPLRSCGSLSWTETQPQIGASRLVLTDRAGRWVTFQVGKRGRSVKEVAGDLGCAWHTVNDAVIAYGSALVDDPERIGEVTALGLDETLLGKVGKWRTKQWSTSIVDVRRGQLLDVVKGRDSLPAVRWLAERGPAWCGRIRYATLDLSGPYRKVFDTMLPDAIQVADPFHLVKVRREAPCVRGRVRDPTRWSVAAGR